MTDDEIAIPESFVPFNPHGELVTYHRHLPHWRQEGATYFVTFRLADSIPGKVLEGIKQERDVWSSTLKRAKENSLDGSIPKDIRAEYEAFLRRYWKVLESELDRSHGSCELREMALREIVVGAIRFFDGQRYEIFSAVVMPNHCHILVRPIGDFALEKIIGSWKSFAANQIHKETGKLGALWQDESFDRIVRDAEHFRKCVRYIWNNPVKANLAEGESELWIADTIKAGK